MPGSHYDNLRITPTATPFEVRLAYRRMAGPWHPDGWQQREQALGDAMFRALAEALSVLSDPDRRARYDQSLDGDALAGPSVALDSAGALAVFTREMQDYAGELAAQGLAPEDVARYLASLGVPGAVAQSLCGLAPKVARAPASRSRRRVLLLALIVVIVATLVVMLFPPMTARTTAPPAAQVSDPARVAAGGETAPAAPTPVESETPEQRSAREFNRMMAEFEQRHPEFDPRSSKYDASASDALRRRIEVLEREGYDSPEALRQAMSEYERLLTARAASQSRGATPVPPTGQAPARAQSPGAAPVPPVQAPPDGDALRTLCETFPHACRR